MYYPTEQATDLLCAVRRKTNIFLISLLNKRIKAIVRAKGYL